jgi:hypothetical protein
MAGIVFRLELALALGSTCRNYPLPPLIAFARSVLSSIVVAVLAEAAAMGAAVKLQISRLLVVVPPSLAYTLLALACLLPVPAAWKRLEHAGFVPKMVPTPHVNSSQVAAAIDNDALIFPTAMGGNEQRTL